MSQVPASGQDHSASNAGLPNTAADHEAKTRDMDVDDNTSDDASTKYMQEGVKQAEALTMSWTRQSLGLAYAL